MRHTVLHFPYLFRQRSNAGQLLERDLGPSRSRVVNIRAHSAALWPWWFSPVLRTSTAERSRVGSRVAERGGEREGERETERDRERQRERHDTDTDADADADADTDTDAGTGTGTDAGI